MPATCPISWGRFVGVAKNPCLAGEETQHSRRLAVVRVWKRPGFGASVINFLTMIRPDDKDYERFYIEELCRKVWRQKLP